jgi:hypothetical protein
VERVNLGLAVTAIVLPLIVAEIGEVSPWLARRVLQLGAKCIGNPKRAERYAEEWLAGIEETPGKLTKLFTALGLVLSAVPSLHWQSRRLVYLWPFTRIADSALAILSPSLSRKFRSRHIGGFQALVVAHPGFRTTLGDMLQCLKAAMDAPIPTRFLPRTLIVRSGGLIATINFDQRSIILASVDAPKSSKPKTIASIEYVSTIN